MTLYPNPNNEKPKVDSTSYIHPTAQIIGKVSIGPGVFIGPNAVIRADETNDKGQVLSIEIGPECNVQDGVIIHALGGTKVTIGRRTSLAHGCIIHGPCIIGEGCFIGFGAVIYNAVLGNGVYVGTAAVAQGIELTPKALVPPSASVLSEEDITRFVSVTGSKEREFMDKVVATNLALTKGYIASEDKK